MVIIMFKITFKDGVEVTITSVQDLSCKFSIDCDDFFVNVFGGSTEDVAFNTALSMGNEGFIFSDINDRLGGVLTA